MPSATAKKSKTSANDIHDFHEQLKAILPRLRVYALSLTRDRDAADDLVHDTVIKALTGRESFLKDSTAAATAFSMPRFKAMGLAPAERAFKPSP